MSPRMLVDREKIAEFCRRRRIRRMSLFGSVLREDFGPQSDVDVLVAFDPAAPFSAFDIVRIEEELSALFGRKTDLVEEEAVTNPYRRRHILSTRQIVYAA